MHAPAVLKPSWGAEAMSMVEDNAVVVDQDQILQGLVALFGRLGRLFER